MPKWTDYTTKTEPTDNDELMILDTAGKANKRLGLSVFSDWIIGKIANKVFENLQTQNKTILGALNELNSNLLFTRIASTDETNQATINLSDLEHGIYEIYSTVGTFCKIGYSNGEWWLPEKSSENTTISGEILIFDAGSWYTIIYIRKILK